MPEETCAPRIASLSEQAKALEGRASELAAQKDDEQHERISDEDLDALRVNLRAATKATASASSRCSKP